MFIALSLLSIKSSIQLLLLLKIGPSLFAICSFGILGFHRAITSFYEPKTIRNTEQKNKTSFNKRKGDVADVGMALIDYWVIDKNDQGCSKRVVLNLLFSKS